VLDVLPALLDNVQLACHTATGDELLRVYGLAADAYQVTGSVMLKLGDSALAAYAADRSIDAAMRSQDPVVAAASARIVTHSLMQAGHPRRAQEIASLAAERLAADVPRKTEDMLSVYGALLLRGAVAAANGEDRVGAGLLLDEAQDAARRLGRDDNVHWTAFGPLNVVLHRVNVAKVLGDAGTAVHWARSIDVGLIPIAERRATLYLDTAEAFVQWGKHEQAFQALRMAERVAPEEVRRMSTARRVLANLSTTAPRNLRAEVYSFAAQVGVNL
jgi:hypothetical protein